MVKNLFPVSPNAAELFERSSATGTSHRSIRNPNWGEEGTRMPMTYLDKSQNELVVEVPGIKKSDITVNFLDSGYLDINAGREDTDGSLSLRKFSVGHQLPIGIDGNTMKANYADGVLKISIPKATGSKTIGRMVKIDSKRLHVNVLVAIS